YAFGMLESTSSRRSVFLLLFYSVGAHPVLHSFPTRRSSDLPGLERVGRGRAAALVRRALVCAAGRVRLLLVGRAVHDVDATAVRSEEHTSELQSPYDLVCRLLLEKKKTSSQIT